ncbi:MAG: hypothetical protein GY788_11900 [bacterium]|nr:hypothetical protein [bacterium]
MRSSIGSNDEHLVAQVEDQTLGQVRQAREVLGLDPRIERDLFLLGSWTYGIGDAWSDVDAYFILDADGYARDIKALLTSGALTEGEGVAEFVLPNRLSVNVENRQMRTTLKLLSLDEVRYDLTYDCPISLFVLSKARLLEGTDASVAPLIERADRWFAANVDRLLAEAYGHAARFARYLDLAVARADPVAAMLALDGLVRWSLSACCYVDGRPRSPDKWLHVWCRDNCAHGVPIVEAACRVAEVHPLHATTQSMHLMHELRTAVMSEQERVEWIERAEFHGAGIIPADSITRTRVMEDSPPARDVGAPDRRA